MVGSRRGIQCQHNCKVQRLPFTSFFLLTIIFYLFVIVFCLAKRLILMF